MLNNEMSENRANDHLIAVQSLRANTTYLWEKLKKLKSKETALMCRIRKATFLAVSEDLQQLSNIGHCTFSISGSKPNGDEMILMLRMADISEDFKDLVNQQ